MSKRKTSRLEEAASQIDLRLGDLLGQLGEALEEAAGRLADGESGEIRRERQFETGRGPIRASAGIRIRTLGESLEEREGGAGPRPRPEEPVNAPSSDAAAEPTKHPQKAAEATAKQVDATVFEEPGIWSLVADMPGITDKDVVLKQDAGLLHVTARNDARHYIVETALPAEFSNAPISVVVQNGILELVASAEESAAQ